VKWFRHEKGYGFLIPEDGTRDLFFQYGAIIGREPEEDDQVLHVAAMRNGKRAAIEVKVL
jgi:cold shock CspA family protein